MTGATGFIGRNLVEQLLKREGTIYLLVLEGQTGSRPSPASRALMTAAERPVT